MIYHRVLLHSFDKLFMTKLENICLDLNDYIVNFMQYILISMKYCNTVCKQCDNWQLIGLSADFLVN